MTPATGDRPRSTWWRVVALLGVALLVPLGGLTTVAVQESAQAVQRQAEARAVDSAVAAGEAIARRVDGLGALLEGYAHNAQLQRAVRSPEAPGARTVLAEATEALSAALPGSAGAVVTDAEGVLLRSWPHRPETVGTDFSGRDWFRGTLAAGGTYASDGYVTRAPGAPAAIAVSVPLREGEGPGAPTVGVLAVTLRLDALSRSLAATVPTGGLLLVTDGDGRLIAAPHREDVALQDELADPHVRAALAGHRGAAVDGDALEGYAPVERWGWSVRTQLPASTAATETAALRRTVVGAAVLVAVVVCAALALLAVALRRRQLAERELGDVARQLEERQRFTSTLLETMDVPVLSCDGDLRVTYLNRAAAQDLVEHADERGDLVELFAGVTVLDADGHPVPAQELPVARAVRTGEPASAPLLLRREGRPDTHLVVHARPLRDATGAVVGGVSATHDVTLLHERGTALAVARDEALAAASAKTAFLAAVSHEIRTPLNGVLGMLELLLLHPLAEDQRERATTARDSGQTLLRLLTDVLDLSKGDAGRLRLAARPHDPVQVLQAAVAVFEGPAQGKGLALRTSLEGLPAQVVVDAERLTQVVLNLVGNAVKFTDSGSVDVTARMLERDLVVEVADTGPGISEADRARLFVPFEQGDAGRLRGGTGLGLALVRQVVDLLGGELQVRSALGGGSAFSVRLPVQVLQELPVAAAPAVAVPAPRPAEQARVLDGVRVLVAEDNPVNQLVLREQLGQLGAVVAVVGDGAQALEAARRGGVDLVVLDWQMPVLDGLEAARALRADPVTAHLPLVGLTARTFPEDVAACREAGMDVVLAKPCSSEQLVVALLPLLVPARPRA